VNDTPPTTVLANTNSSNPILIFDDNLSSPNDSLLVDNEHSSNDEVNMDIETIDNIEDECSLRFAEESDCVRVGPSELLQCASEFTIEFWLFVEQESTGMLVSKKMNYSVWIKDQHIYFSFYTKSSGLPGQKIPILLPLSKWTHISISYDGTRNIMAGYINNLAVYKSNAFSGPFLQSNYPVIIGAVQLDGLSFVGVIRDLRLWRCALSQHELHISMHNEFIQPTPSLMGWWPMNKIGKEVLDLGPNGVHGTISGAVWVGTRSNSFAKKNSLQDSGSF